VSEEHEIRGQVVLQDQWENRRGGKSWVSLELPKLWGRVMWAQSVEWDWMNPHVELKW